MVNAYIRIMAADLLPDEEFLMQVEQALQDLGFELTSIQSPRYNLDGRSTLHVFEFNWSELQMRFKATINTDGCFWELNYHYKRKMIWKTVYWYFNATCETWLPYSEMDNELECHGTPYVDMKVMLNAILRKN